MSVSKDLKFQASKKHKLFPCAICKKMTEQTCSLCRKVFYCSPQHQQIDWHMKHKMQCEGKIIQNTPNQQRTNQQWTTNQTITSSEKFKSSNDHAYEIETKTKQVRLQNQSREFMNLFEQRLILRKKCISLYIKLVQSNRQVSQQDFQPMVNSLCESSNKLLTIFKPIFIPILEETYGMTTSQFILKLDEILDAALMAKFHLLIHKHQDVRRFLFMVQEEMPPYKTTDPRFRQVYENVLKAVIKISETHCNDKVTESLLTKFIVLVEKFDGISEQVYAYFNMGNWYLNKTYHQKAIMCFNHSLQLLNLHRTKSQSTDSSILTKADLLFNMSLAQYSVNNEKSAFDNMQESYRLRIKAIGKNSIEASRCLQSLARWAFANKYWEDCLQYAKQCFRVRKLNNINYPKELQSIEKLLENIYRELKKEKEKSEQLMNPKPVNYYETLLFTNKQAQPSQSYIQPQQSFIKQLNSSMKEELIPFRIVITPQMAQTYSSIQWQKLNKLLEVDKMMEKEEMRRVIFESQFTESLNQSQKDAFIKANRID